jgi:aromatic ring-cleaving dioxygenase
MECYNIHLRRTLFCYSDRTCENASTLCHILFPTVLMEQSLDHIQDFHAHIYYSPETRDRAAWIRERLEAQFAVRLGRWHDRPVGPHPQAMYQVVFTTEQFGTVVPWLMLNHQGLAVLIHPSTGDDLGDHRDRALWLGEQLALNLAFLAQG